MSIYINEYHDSHDCSPIFFGGRDDGQTAFLGVELEIDRRHNSPPYSNDDMAREIIESMPKEFVYCEYDGSLRYGFENITQPATLEYHMSISELYKDMMKAIVRNGYRSHDVSSCGLHVHFNRSFFGNKEEECITKLLFLVEKHWDNLIKFSRRNYNNIENWAKKYECSPEKVVEDMLNGDLCDRYYAINLINYATVEFRLFKGTLNYNSFIATLQLVDTFIKACKNKPIEELRQMNFEDFLLYDEIKTYWEVAKNRVVRD